MIKDFANSKYKKRRKIKKDYKRRQFVNPYFENKREKSGGFNTPLYLKIIAGVFLIYVIIYSDLFKIKTIEVNGTDMIGQEELRQKVDEEISSWRWYLLPQKNLLFISKKGLSESINNEYKLKKLEIDRGWRKLTINIEEKINYLIIYNNEKFFFADEEGSITTELSQEQAMSYWDKFPILNIYKEINTGDRVTSAKMVEFILEFNTKIKYIGIEFHGYETNGESEITLVSKTGWRAHFDIYSDINLSIENMQLVLNEKIDDETKLEYIDLRFGNKVFYK
jgi:hypothetical protein